MKKLTRAGVATMGAAIMVAAMGCADTEAPSTMGECREVNGLMINASGFNGRSMNAHMLNGLYGNGAKKQGTFAQGGYLQGIDLHGALLGNGPILQGTMLEADGVAITEGEIIAVTDAGDEVPLTVRAAEPDELAPELSYYELTTEDGINVCGPEGRGLFVEGVWNFDNGDRLDELQVGEHLLTHSFSCMTGVIAKCVAWGYQPWEHGADMHQTCTRLARADYCGDGIPHTENGTLIDVYDPEGILERESDMDFEAGWGPDGAVCVSHPRYLDVVVGQGPVYPSCWSDLPSCDNVDEAEQHGATMVNASTQKERLWCDESDFQPARKRPGR